MADDEAGRPNLVIFWKIVFPILTIVLLLFVLFITFSLPDWAVGDTCANSLTRISKLVEVSAATAATAATASTASANA